MAKEEAITLEGVVTEVLRNTTYRVKLDGFENPVLATLSGKIRQFNIKVVDGDRVRLEFSPYDLTRGRITRRL